MKKRFSYGVCEWSVKTRGKALCKMASDSGLHCLQLGVGTEVLRGEGLGDGKRVEEYLTACADYGIVISSLSPQFVDEYSFTMPGSAQEEETALALTDKTIEFCRIFGCKSFLLPVLGRNDICDGTTFHRAVEYIKRFSYKAGVMGIKTHLELNQSVEGVRNLLDAVDDPNVRLYFDSQNLYAKNGTAMAGYFKALSDVTGGVHLKDGVGTMLSGSLLGEGTSGFYKTAQAILESSYQGDLIIESVYSKPSVCRLGTERELLKRDADTLLSVFEFQRKKEQGYDK